MVAAGAQAQEWFYSKVVGFFSLPVDLCMNLSHQKAGITGNSLPD